MLWIIVSIVAAIAVAGTAGLLWLRTQWKKDDASLEQNRFVAERKWGWESAYSQVEEEKLLAELERLYRDGLQSFTATDGYLLVYDEPPMVVSLTALAPLWRAELQSTKPDLDALLDRVAASPPAGVLPLSEPWFVDDAGEELVRFDGLSADQWTERLARMTALNEQVRGWQVDEDLGYLAIRVLAAPSERLASLQAHGQFEALAQQETHEQNVLLIDLGKLFARYRAESEDATIEQRLRTVLLYFVAEAPKGATWCRPATEAERSAVANAVATPSEETTLLSDEILATLRSA